MTSDVRSDRLVFLHGFTQTHHHWHRCAALIAASVGEPTCAFVDLPGHGLSSLSDPQIDEATSPLVAVAGRGTYVGYSMGGRYALTAAVARHRQIERLVLIGATAGFVSARERTERIRLDEERAVALERDGIEEFLDSWLAGPMFAALPDDPHGRLRRERNTATGLAASLRGAGTGSQAPQWSSLDSIEIPVLVIAGERDEKFTEIGRRLTDGIPNGEFVNIEHAGHATHIERPDATRAAIVAWLRRCR